MTERPLAGDLDTALDPAPGYYPDPSVPGFVRYWGGSAWVPGTSRPAPPTGEPLAPPRGAPHRAAATFAPAAPPPRPVVMAQVHVEPVLPGVPPVPHLPAALRSGASGASGPSGVSAPTVQSVEETGPVFFDQTSGGASFTLAPYAERELQQAVQEPPAATAWRAAPTAQPEVVSWGAVAATLPEPLPVPAPSPAPAPAAVLQVAEAAPAPTPAPTPMPTPAPVATPEPTPAPVKAAATVRPPVATRPPTARRAATRKPPAPLPAGLGRRAVARLVDTAALALVAVAAGVPTVGSVITHIDEKVVQARQASMVGGGGQVRVWLVDGLVVGRVGVLLGILLLAALLYEVVPVSRTGQTFGKRLVGIRVADATRAAPAPSFGRSLLRWSVRQLAVLSVVGLFAPLRDRSARRGWQDRAARTRVVRA
ncbi:RDD family protein [Kitasatospora sp. NPDC002040]|uniref:RDD family protein n=1 Tax=Kitasatospora sp. NPDC002040 TaxID=3154661 RepID=UPI003322A16F